MATATVNRRFIVVLCALISVLMLGVVSSARAANMIANPGFEISTSGWGGYSASVTRIQTAGAPGGSYVGRVQLNAWATEYSVVQQNGVFPISSTTAGRQYVASAYVQSAHGSATGRPIYLVIHETTPAGTTVKRTTSTRSALATTWSRISVTATASGTGNRLAVYVFQAEASALENAFNIDEVSIDVAAATVATPPLAPTSVRSTAITSSSVAIAWNATSGSSAIAKYQIMRNGALAGEVAGSVLAFTDSGLNAATSYTYTVQAIDAVGLVSDASGVLNVTTTQAATSGAAYFSPTSFWNVRLPASVPIDAVSSSFVNDSLVVWGAKSPAFMTGRDWGLPVYQASSTDPLYKITGSLYDINGAVECRIPSNAQPATGGDMHLIVLQPDGSECDYWGFAWWRFLVDGPSAWSVGKVCGIVSGPNRNAWGTQRCKGTMGGGMVAAGWSALGGAVTPDEIKKGFIPHALAVVLPESIARPGFVWPAVSGDGTSTAAATVAEGTRIRLDPTYNIDADTTLTSWQKTLLHAMQDYGAFVSDVGGQMGIRATVGASDSDWTNVGVGINASIKNLPWNRMQVVQTTPAGTQPAWSTAS